MIRLLCVLEERDDGDTKYQAFPFHAHRGHVTVQDLWPNVTNIFNERGDNSLALLDRDTYYIFSFRAFYLSYLGQAETFLCTASWCLHLFENKCI